jgi:hypothetical protein
VPRDFILFDDYLACIRLINASFTRTVTLARHSCPADAAKFFVPSAVGMVFANPPYAETNGTLRIHWLLRNVVSFPADVVRLVPKVLPVAQSAFRILVNRQHDRLHVMIAVSFMRTDVPNIGERLKPGFQVHPILQEHCQRYVVIVGLITDKGL